MPEGVAPDPSAGQWLGWWLDRRLGPIHHEACATSNTDQPDSVPHVRDIVPWRDVGTIEAALTSRANRGGPAGESGADVFDLILFELLVHAKEVSRERFKLASCLQLAKGRQHPSRRTITLPSSPRGRRGCTTLNTTAEMRVPQTSNGGCEVGKTYRCSLVGGMLSSP